MSDPAPAPPPLPAPSRAYDGSSAGYDLYLPQDVTLYHGQGILISFIRPQGCQNVLYMMRSSVQKQGVHVSRVVSDEALSGVVVLELVKVGAPAWVGRRGDRVVQALYLPFHKNIVLHRRMDAHDLFATRLLPDPSSAPLPERGVDNALSVVPFRMGGSIVSSLYDGEPFKRGGEFGLDGHVSLPALLELAPYETRLVPTGYRSRLQAGQALLVGGSFHLSAAGVFVAGVVDAGYQGEIFAMLTNTTASPVRPANAKVSFVITRVLAAYNDVGNARGAGGFGSSGR